MNPILQIKNPYDAAEVTSAINMAPYVPGELGYHLPWNEEGVRVRQIFVELNTNGSLKILDESDPLGPKGNAIKQDARKGFTLMVPYYVQFDTVRAEFARALREFGGSGLTPYLEEFNKKMVALQKNNEVRREFNRACALRGAVAASDNTVLQDVFAASGKTQSTATIALGTTTTDVLADLSDIQALAEEVLGDYQGMITGWKLINGSNMQRKFTRHASVKEAFKLWSATGAVGNLGSQLRENYRAPGFHILPDTECVDYRKAKVGTTFFIDPDKSYLCPIIEGLYQTRNAPGTGVSELNEPGLPEYVKIKKADWDQGDDVMNEMSTISYVERPEAIIEITDSDA